MYELARAGIGSNEKKGGSGATGILLIEKNSENHTCGIIEPITMPESSGLDQNPFSENYKPYRITTHAMRVNIGTQHAMRCLANELNITVYYTPWVTEYRRAGYRAFNGWIQCGADTPKEKIPNGFGSNCKAACLDGFKSIISDKNSPAYQGECGTFNGSPDLVENTSGHEQKAYKFFNYDPQNNYNQQTFDPEVFL